MQVLTILAEALFSLCFLSDSIVYYNTIKTSPNNITQYRWCMRRGQSKQEPCNGKVCVEEAPLLRYLQVGDVLVLACELMLQLPGSLFAGGDLLLVKLSELRKLLLVPLDLSKEAFRDRGSLERRKGSIQWRTLELGMSSFWLRKEGWLIWIEVDSLGSGSCEPLVSLGDRCNGLVELLKLSIFEFVL